MQKKIHEEKLEILNLSWKSDKLNWNFICGAGKSFSGSATAQFRTTMQVCFCFPKASCVRKKKVFFMQTFDNTDDADDDDVDDVDGVGGKREREKSYLNLIFQHQENMQIWSTTFVFFSRTQSDLDSWNCKRNLPSFQMHKEIFSRGFFKMHCQNIFIHSSFLKFTLFLFL